MKTFYANKGGRVVVYLLILCAFLSDIPVRSQSVELVKDISPGGLSMVSYKVDMDGILIFSAYESIHGSELWKSEGTGPGTGLLKDINPGAANANISDPIYYQGRIYFSADNGVNGREIWVTDGSADGTYMLKDINPSGNGSFSSAIVFNGLLFFRADDGVHGNEWWTTDGTPEGTVLFADNSSIGGGPEDAVIFNGKLFYSYNDGVHGLEPWVSDGTPEGTQLLLNINQTNSLNSLPENFTAYDGLLYFHADNGVHGSELWATDGTTEGTQMVKDIRNGAIGAFPRYFIVFNDRLYFGADDGTHGVELWMSDGTTDGTLMVKDIHTSGSSDLIGFVHFSDALFFSALDGVHGREAWISDGTSEGTQMLHDLNPSGNGMPGYFSNSTVPTQFGDHLFFIADAGTNGFELWYTDGTPSGAQLMEPDGATGTTPLDLTNGFVQSGSALYFDANFDGTGEDLYRIVSGTVGLTDTATEQEKLRVYPNPSSGKFQIALSSVHEAETKIEIVNLLGERVFEKRMYPKGSNYLYSIEAELTETGIYLVRIMNGPYSRTCKLILE